MSVISLVAEEQTNLKPGEMAKVKIEIEAPLEIKDGFYDKIYLSDIENCKMASSYSCDGTVVYVGEYKDSAFRVNYKNLSFMDVETKPKEFNWFDEKDSNYTWIQLAIVLLVLGVLGFLVYKKLRGIQPVLSNLKLPERIETKDDFDKFFLNSKLTTLSPRNAEIEKWRQSVPNDLYRELWTDKEIKISNQYLNQLRNILESTK